MTQIEDQNRVLSRRTESDAAAHKSNNVKRKLGTTASPAPPATTPPSWDSADGKSNHSSEDDRAKGGGGGPDLAVRLIVVGGRQVGKSALTVRYLTRRYIGEYQSFSGE